jgi:hypothetical protein
MKKILTLLFLHLSVSSFAQISFGIKGGLNLNNVAAKNPQSNFFTVDTNGDIGFHGGVYGKIRLNDEFSFIPELQFTRRGYFSNNFFSSEKTHIRLDYVELPLLISYAPIKKLAIDLGLDVSYIVSAVAKNESTSYNIRDFLDKQFDWGLTGGLRFKIIEKISLIGRYYFGLAAINKIDFRDEMNNPLGALKIYNRGAQFGVTYQLK